MKKISLNKIIRDLWLEKSRAVIVLIAIIIGTFSVSMMTTAYTVLERNLKANYLGTNPASFTIIGKNLNINVIKNNKNIAELELRNKIVCRFQLSENNWLPFWIYVVDDFDKVKINTFKLQSGMIPRYDDEILIERTANRIFNIQLNKKYLMNIPGFGNREIKLSGIAHDPGQAPSWMEGIIYGYAKRELFDSTMLSNQEIKVIVAKNNFDLEQIQTVLNEIKNLLISKGGTIERTEILPPGEHPHEGQLNSLMFLLQMFGILTLFLSGFLIINMISAIMVKQMRQIGIMKAIGASTSKITGIYISVVLIMGIIASLIAIPFGVYFGIKYAAFTATILNFDILNSQIPILNIVFQFSIGILIPVLVTIFPIYKSSRISVQKALNDHGITGTTANENEKRFSLANIPGISNTFRFAARNSFRRKGRLILTLITLFLGGAFYITAFNIRSSSNYTVETQFNSKNYEMMIYFKEGYTDLQLQEEFEKIDGVKKIELADILKTTIVNDKEFESPITEMKVVNQNSIDCLPEMISGNWQDIFDGGVAVNNATLAKNPGLVLGSIIKLKIFGQIIELPIKGIVSEVFAKPLIYVSSDCINYYLPKKETQKMAFVTLKNEYKNRSTEIIKEIEKHFSDTKIEITNLIPKDENVARVEDHLQIITTTLIMITLLLIFVGGLGIITTMSINILERSREIGILRAIGVANKPLYKILLYEGLSIGIISWVFSVIFSFPLSYYLGNKFFIIFFNNPINYMISPLGIFSWLIIVILFSGISVLIPARSASKLSVNTILSYE